MEKFDRAVPASATRLRPGTHHAAVTVRVVDRQSRPIAAVPVVLYARPAGWGGSPWPLAETLTAGDGVARLEDVGSDHPLLCQIEPERSYLRATRAVPAVTDGEVDLGTVPLDHAMPLRATFRIFAEDGSAFATHSTRITVSEPSAQRFGPRVASGSAKDGVFLLEHVPAGRFRFEVSTWVGKPTPFRSFSGEFTVDADPARRNLVLTAKVPAKRGGAASEDDPFAGAGKPEALQIAVAPPAPLDSRPVFRLAGRVVDARGAPAAGCLVNGFASAFFDLATRKAYGVTDADGRFSLSSFEDPFTHLVVLGPCGLLNLEITGPLADRSFSPDRVQLEDTRGAPLKVVPPAGGPPLTASHNVDGLWHPCPIAAIGRFLPDPDHGYERGRFTRVEPAVCRIEIPGRLPAVVVAAPDTNPKDLDLSGGAIPYELTVRSGGKPVPNARVDVEIADVGRGIGRVEIARLVTGIAGEIAIAGSSARDYRVYVHAPNLGPASAIWRPREPLEIVLRERSVEFVLTDLAALESANVTRAGGDELVATVAPGSARPARVRLEPGSYDVTVLDEGRPVRGRSLAASGGGTTTVSLAADDRPRISVKLPRGEDGTAWTAWLSRGIPPFGSVGAAAWTNAGGFGGHVPASVTVDSSNGTLVVAGSGTGPYFLSLAKKEGPFALRREVVLEAGRKNELATRPLDATVTGSMLEFDAPEFSQHGVAGPRLVLASATDSEPQSAWDVVIGLPEPEKDGSFKLTGLPAGTYVALHHLAGRTVYGGGVVVAKAGEQAAMPSFRSKGADTLDVRVHEAGGALARGGSVAIYDPMAEAWQAFLEIPTTASLAAKQIPAAPTRRLPDAAKTAPSGGKAERTRFLSVVPGVLPIDVRMDDGRAFRFWRRVNPGEPLDLTLPQGK